jgi:hypothetical protein
MDSGWKSFGDSKRGQDSNALPFLSFEGKADVKASLESTLYRDPGLRDCHFQKYISPPFGPPKASRAFSSSGYSSELYRSVNLGVPDVLIPKDIISEKAAILKRSSSVPVQDLQSKLPSAPPGGYLEKHTTFFTHEDPRTCFKLLREVLRTLRVDFEEYPQEYELRCEAFPKGVRLPFNVRIFAHEAKYAIEVQRRAGDAFCFSKIYRKLVSQCVRRKICDENAVPPKSDFVGFGDLDSNGSGYKPDSEELNSSMLPLLEMAGSKYIDVKSTAAAAIAEMTADESTLGWFAEHMEEHVGLMEQLLTSEIQDVSRCALTSVANLTVDERVCEVLEKNGYVTNLVGMLRSTCKQVVRESTRALMNFGKTSTFALFRTPFWSRFSFKFRLKFCSIIM